MLVSVDIQYSGFADFERNPAISYWQNKINMGLLMLLSGLQVEDRPIVKEIKTYIREHHPVEKEFVVETRPTG